MSWFNPRRLFERSLTNRSSVEPVLVRSNDPTRRSAMAMLTLTEAVDLLDKGGKFGDVFPFLLDNEGRTGEDLKTYFCTGKLPREGATLGEFHDPEATPVPASLVSARSPIPPVVRSGYVRPAPPTRLSGTTGNPCPKCQGGNVVWDGKCQKCLDCGEGQGNCS